MFVTFLLFQSNLYVVLARGKNSVHRDLFKTKNSKQNTLRPAATFYALRCVDRPSAIADFPKCLKNVIFPKFLVNTLYVHMFFIGILRKNI